jgi:hypothetical protein
MATVPNIVLGVAILVFRKRILKAVQRLVPTMTEDGAFWASRVTLIGGLFLIVVASFVLVGVWQMLT